MNIDKLIKGGILEEIEPEKVSLVKSPANQRRFIITKQANIEFTGSTDQTFDGTTITVNGEELEDFESFHFSAVNWSEKDMEEWGAIPISLSFSTKKSTVDGLDVIETFSLHSEVKKTMEKSEILKATKESLGIELDEAGFDKLPVEKQKALEALAVFAPAMNGQPAFRDAVAVFAKSGTEVPEAEPETSNDDPPEDPPQDPPETPPADEKTEADKRMDALEESLKEINQKLDKKPDESGGDGNTAEPVTKADLEALANQLQLIDTRQLAIAKAAGIKESSEIDIEKAGGGKDEWKWGGAKLDN